MQTMPTEIKFADRLKSFLESRSYVRYSELEQALGINKRMPAEVRVVRALMAELGWAFHACFQPPDDSSAPMTSHWVRTNFMPAPSAMPTKAALEAFLKDTTTTSIKIVARHFGVGAAGRPAKALRDLLLECGFRKTVRNGCTVYTRKRRSPHVVLPGQVERAQAVTDVKVADLEAYIESCNPPPRLVEICAHFQVGYSAKDRSDMRAALLRLGYAAYEHREDDRTRTKRYRKAPTEASQPAVTWNDGPEPELDQEPLASEGIVVGSKAPQLSDATATMLRERADALQRLIEVARQAGVDEGSIKVLGAQLVAQAAQAMGLQLEAPSSAAATPASAPETKPEGVASVLPGLMLTGRPGIDALRVKRLFTELKGEALEDVQTAPTITIDELSHQIMDDYAKVSPPIVYAGETVKMFRQRVGRTLNALDVRAGTMMRPQVGEYEYPAAAQGKPKYGVSSGLKPYVAAYLQALTQAPLPV